MIYNLTLSPTTQFHSTGQDSSDFSLGRVYPHRAFPNSARWNRIRSNPTRAWSLFIRSSNVTSQPILDPNFPSTTCQIVHQLAAQFAAPLPVDTMPFDRTFRSLSVCPTLTDLAIPTILKFEYGGPMNVHLTPELEQLVQAKVQSGRYNSASEVVREALRIMEQRDELRSIQLQELRNRMDRAIGESARGEGTDGEEFMQRMLDDLDTGHRRKAG